jgi:iron complex transport system ATP-binding protein
MNLKLDRPTKGKYFGDNVLLSLKIKDVAFSYFNGLVLDGINLNLDAGEMIGLLGPNGSGKSTLIKIACGLLRPVQGKVVLDGVEINNWKRKNIARLIAVVPQQLNIPFGFTVEEVVNLGRIPFLKPLADEKEADIQMVRNAMDLVGVAPLRERRFNELSGGEKQKAILAMALAQEPKILLLDEPTAHLDINHQIQIFELVQRLNTEKHITVMAALHDLNMAALYFKRLVLLKKGKILIDGTPDQVITEGRIKDVFGADVVVSTHPTTGQPHVIIKPSGI